LYLGDFHFKSASAALQFQPFQTLKVTTHGHVFTDLRDYAGKFSKP